MIAQEVCYCVSALVSTLAMGSHAVTRNTDMGRVLSDLIEQALELALPIDDWEGAAIREGWRWEKGGRQNEGAPHFYRHHAKGFGTDYCACRELDWRALCLEQSIEPYQREVFEHWIVSDWLADKLEAHGEKVDTDFAGLTVWARTATGQGIASDSVIEAIYAELMA
ncbi:MULTISPECIES: hypothetical protein [unclassified Aurantimonas]|uniref:hypothetical protein n=1 Tax=unclassified Aurantimonas TaxID=2638230 RepID=UPI002E19168C|nr:MULTISPECIES: hypothetical protein [unclassified Aurantimonas]MEC5291571.1 hypothetical protein [Aurantimonas sp. C2-3-R2]MEC5412655.1 hypothetical protein [Aurantimonas sp. C2-4-R8]